MSYRKQGKQKYSQRRKNKVKLTRKQIRPKIEREITGKRVRMPLLGYQHPPIRVRVDDAEWTLFSTRGVYTKKEAEAQIKETPELNGKRCVVVKWKRPYFVTPKWYVYWGK